MRKFLHEHFLFKTLSPQQIERLSSCSTVRTVNRGATIFARGDPGSSMFAICKGTVKIGVASADGHDAIFNLLCKGDIFGEIAILEGNPRSADAVATADCDLFVIERRDFLPILRSEPELALKFIEVLCERLRRTSLQAETLMVRSLPNRLAMALLQLADSGASEGNPKVAVTQHDLASIIGMSRESTNKQLRSWAAKDLVRLKRGGIVIMCVDALMSIAEGDDTATRALQSRDGFLQSGASRSHLDLQARQRSLI
jgi:CRP/FNR family cyclic AMP-dependent transcriptional regulator